MNTFTVKDNAGQTWKRVSKVAARKAFDNGQAVHVCPSNLMPFGYWGCGVTCLPGFEQHEYVAPDESPFDYWVKNFEWYNCTGRETGTYASFYVHV